MDATQFVRFVVDSGGKSQRAIAAEIGKSPTYLSSHLTGGHVPQLDTAVLIARACGYSLALIPDGQLLPPGTIIID